MNPGEVPNGEYPDKKESLRECKIAARELFAVASKLAQDLNKDGKESEPAKAAEALGLNEAVVTLGEYADKIASLDDINQIQQEFTLQGRAVFSTNFYSIAKAVFANDERFSSYIRNFEQLIDAINSNKPTRPFILPVPIFAKFDETIMQPYSHGSFVRQEAFEVRSVYEAMDKFFNTPRSAGDNHYNYVGSVLNPGYQEGYKMMVGRINPSDWQHMDSNIRRGKKRNPKRARFTQRPGPFADYQKPDTEPEEIEFKLIEF